MAVSLAILMTLKIRVGGLIGSASCVAGHLSESILPAGAGTLPLEDAACLLKARGRAMQQAVPAGEGAMAVILGLGLNDAADVALEAAGGMYVILLMIMRMDRLYYLGLGLQCKELLKLPKIKVQSGRKCLPLVLRSIVN